MNSVGFSDSGKLMSWT